jgi:hypothetical protein
MGSAAVIPDNLWRNSSVEESYGGKEVTGGRNSGTPVPSGQYSENDIFISVAGFKITKQPLCLPELDLINYCLFSKLKSFLVTLQTIS